MKKMLFVFNPNSGKAQIKNSLLKIIQIFSNADYEVTVYPTKAALDGFERVKADEGRYDVIVCSGGDGTLNEIVSAVAGYSTVKPPIGYIPSGSTNDFARSLGIPSDKIRAACNIINGESFPCDIGIANDHKYFNYVAAFGAFTDVAYETPQDLKNVLGHQAYVIEGVKRLSNLKACRMKIKSDELNVEDSFIYGMVSNASSIGGMKGLIAEGVDYQDGMFEVTLIREIKNPMDLQAIVNAFITQKIDDCDMVYTFKTKDITFESKEEVKWTLDGEPALGIHHGGQKPLGAPQKLLCLVGSVQDLHLRDAAVFHGHLHPDGTAVAPGRADVNAIGIGQLGQGFFLRFNGSSFHRLLHHGCQFFRHGSQHRHGAGQGKKHGCCCRHRREQLHQRQQRFASCFVHSIFS